ncbi:hypothetical protein [Luteipulveratus mongoliensis]|uniref:Uncharacterized protein n=1 Tax=Luteipulveratus mongoliensis TaxID=571913 RepID=A0A0K1JEA1_9MICO|nr:hypothetical protein [Luteipulveratus mongoliensis]AKU15042.1 hypothetical protein VV02_02850 [Luteipulveratus mongoliensis]
MENLVTIINWVAWIVAIICVLAFLASLGVMAMGAVQGREIEGIKGLGTSLVATIAIGATTSIIGTFTGGLPFKISPTEVPGMHNIVTLINWTAWGVVMVAVLAFLASLAMMAMSAVRGRSIEGLPGLGMSVVACIGVGATGLILGTFTGGLPV